MKSQRDVAGLTAALERSDDSDAVLFAIALGELGDSSAVQPLVRRLRRIDLSTPTSDNSNKAAWAVIAEALGQLATPGSPAADELLKALEHPVGDEDLDAMDALATMGDQRASGPVLRRLRSMDDSTGILEWQYVIDVLGRLKVPEAVDLLVDELDSKYLSEEAATALGRIGDPRAVPALAALLEQMPSDPVGEATLEALTKIGTPEATEVVAAWRKRGITLPPDQT